MSKFQPGLAHAPVTPFKRDNAIDYDTYGKLIEFHLKNGFRECGRFMKVGRKFGEDFDVVWMQKQLE